MKLIAPTRSYRIPLPDDIVWEHDGKVASYWREGKQVLLQLSSTVRTEGPQVSAQKRLQDRINKSPGEWFAFQIRLDKSPGDCAAAETLAEDGLKWIHIYITTPWLAIYSTVSGQPSDLATGPGNWALQAIRGIQLMPN